MPLQVLQHAPSIVFLFCLGACVGSFLNVVIYRLPAGMSVISPPSRCPTCGARLRFFRENLPILGWLMVRGRCRYCGDRVSPQYMVIELIMALIFVGLYVVLFITNRNTPWWGEIGGPWWTFNQVYRVWPVYIAFAFLIAGLTAMTIIDARTFHIPIEIPLFVTVTAFIAYPLQALLPHRSPASQTWPIPAVGWQGTLCAVGGMVGVLVGIALLRTGKLRYSFADYDEYVKEGETLGDYPHARREMHLELLFLAPCIVGLVAGFVLGGLVSSGSPPEIVQAIGGTLLGYLGGCALIWGIRIIGTLGFGREAMGVGDVHLLGAVGAVMGWCDPILIFFIAPFSGIIWVLLSMGLSSVFKMARRELPYGPHLALATLIVLLGRPGINAMWNVILPGVPQPKPGLVTSPGQSSGRPSGRPSGPAPGPAPAPARQSGP